MNPLLLGRNTAAGGLQPTAPVLGRESGIGTFTELFVPTSSSTSGGPPPTPQAQTVGTGALYFGWAGADTAEMTTLAIRGISPVSASTNKIAAGDNSQLSFTAVSGPPSIGAPAPAGATAGLCANWGTRTPGLVSTGTSRVVLAQ